MDEEPENPLIFGRPFLASVGAVIDAKNKIVDVNLGTDMRLRFHLRKTPKQYTVEGHTYVLETISKEEIVDSKKSEWEELTTKVALQDKMIQYLHNELSRLQTRAQPQIQIDASSKDKKEPEWYEEEDYPPEEKEAYLRERSIEYAAGDVSREDAEFEEWIPDTEGQMNPPSPDLVP